VVQPGQPQHRVGEAVRFGFDAAKLHGFDAQGERL
jgi:hypothetical protein